MKDKVLTCWAHVRLTLGVDPSKYLHVLVPCQPDENLDLVARYVKHDFLTAIPCIWMSQYRHVVPVCGLELMYDRVTKDTSDLITIIQDSLKDVSDKRVCVLPSDEAFMLWLNDGEGRVIKWHNTDQTQRSERQYLMIEVLEL